MGATIAKSRLFYNADKSALVAEGDPEATTLAAAVGDEVPEGFKVPKNAEDDDDLIEQRAEEERIAKEGHVPTKAEARAADKQASRDADK